MNPYNTQGGWAAYSYGAPTPAPTPQFTPQPAAAAAGYNAASYYANAGYAQVPAAASAVRTITTIHPNAPAAAPLPQQPAGPARTHMTHHQPPKPPQNSWRQIKQEQQAIAAATNPAAGTGSASSSNPAMPTYYPTKAFVKASPSTPTVGGDGKNAPAAAAAAGGAGAGGAAAAALKTEPGAVTASSTSSISGMADDGQSCMKLHEIAVMNKIVETYERITTEVAPGIHGVRLKFGTETFTGTGPNFKAAKQNAAATALAQTKYQKPIEKKTMKVRPHGITATQELHELATKKGLEAKFRFLEPPNFEFKSAMRLWSKDEMRGNYRVQLSINGYEYYGQADLPQQAKHNSAMQALPMLNRIPDAAQASKVQVVVPMTKNGGAPAKGGAGGAGGAAGAAGGDGAVAKNVIMILNEIAMSKSQCMEWNMVREEGPPHARKFTWSLKMGDFLTEGAGCSKKIAKSLAAQSMYEKIPDEWKSGSGSGNPKKRKPGRSGFGMKRSRPGGGGGGADGTGGPGGPSPAKKTKDGEGAPVPAYSVIQATNPISALYEYCRKIKAPDPDFECVSENVLETWQKDHHTFKKTEYTLKLQVQDKQFFASGQTKKAAKTAVANEAWNQLRIETITV